MLTTLLESTSHRARSRRVTAVSVAVHAAIIFTAAYATASGSPNPRPAPEPRVHWIPTPPPLPSSKQTALRSHANRSAAGLPRVVHFPIEVPSAVPVIEAAAPAITEAEFRRASIGDTFNTGRLRAPSGDGGSQLAYDASEVETPVASVGVVYPEYPPALRASGIEGQVVAEFVVDENGRADRASLRIISATNDLFAESIRRALPRMRFKPARIGDRSVAQLVHQQFVFRLDR